MFICSHCIEHGLKNSPPVPGRLDAANAAQSLCGELQSNIGKALDLARGAGPRVGGVPGNGATAQRVNASALGAGGVVALAPEVIVDDIAASSGGSPLVTEVGTTSQRLGWDSSGIAQASERQGDKRERSEGLHDGFEGEGEELTSRKNRRINRIGLRRVD